MEIFNNKISQQNRYNTPKFKANIYILPKASFYTKQYILYENKLITPKGYQLENSIINSTSPTISDEAYDCSVAILTNKDAKTTDVCHIVPNEKTFGQLDEIQEKIYNWGVELYNKTKTKLEGFIVGGKDFEATKDKIHSESLSEAYQRSPILQNKILETYERLHKDVGLDYSVLGLQKLATSRVNVVTDVENNSHYVNVNSYYNHYTKMDEVADIFSNIKISKSDRIFFENKDRTDEFRELIEEKNKAIK